MQKRVLCSMVIFASFVMHGIGEASESDAVAREFAEAIRRSRLAITEGRVVLESSMSKIVDGQLKPVSRTIYTCFFRGPELRMDRTIVRIGSSGAESEILREVNIFDIELSYLHDETPRTGHRVVATVTRDSVEDELRDRSRSRVWDVRMLGLCADPFPILHVYKDWNMVLSTDRVTEISLDASINCLTLKYPFGLQKVFCDPEKSNQPLRIELTTENTNTVVEISLRNWATVSAEPVWFPESVTLTKSKLGGPVTLMNRCLVTQAEFGPSLPQNTFSIAALGLEPGQVVREIRAGENSTREWNGKELVAYKGKREKIPVSQAINARRLVVVIATLLLILGGFVLWMWRRRVLGGLQE